MYKPSEIYNQTHSSNFFIIGICDLWILSGFFVCLNLNERLNYENLACSKNYMKETEAAERVVSWYCAVSIVSSKFEMRGKGEKSWKKAALSSIKG